MNALLKTFKQDANGRLTVAIPKLNQICDMHNTPLIEVKQTGLVICPTCELEKSQSQAQAELKKSITEKHFSAAQLPARYAKCGFSNYHTPSAGQTDARNRCMSFAKNFLNGAIGNLVMTGRTGTGKTHLACAIARNVLASGKFARYITSEDMAGHIASAWTRADDSESAAIYRMTEYDLLILDEYGLHDQHETRLQLVHKVLYSRYEAKKPTVIISNMTLRELQDNLGDRLWSRLQHDGLTAIECNWADARVSA